MAASGFFALLGNLAPTLKDVAAISQTTVKNAVVLGADDLAVSTRQISGFREDRRLSTIKTMAKWSLLSKAVLISAALGISAAGSPGIVTGLLLAGGGYLSYGGIKKILPKLRSNESQQSQKCDEEDDGDPLDIDEEEKKRLRSGLKADFVMSAEIVVVSLGFVTRSPLLTQLGVLAATGAAFTAGVYGAAAVIISSKRASSPKFMRALSVIGAGAMVTVGGGLLMNHLPGVAPAFHNLTHILDSVPYAGKVNSYLLSLVGDALGGVVAGTSLVAGKKIAAPAVTTLKDAMSSMLGKNIKSGVEAVMPPAPLKGPALPSASNNVPDDVAQGKAIFVGGAIARPIDAWEAVAANSEESDAETLEIQGPKQPQVSNLSNKDINPSPSPPV